MGFLLSRVSSIFQEERSNWGGGGGMKSQVLHTVWWNISGEATGEVWNWSLLGVKGLINPFKEWQIKLIPNLQYGAYSEKWCLSCLALCIMSQMYSSILFTISHLSNYNNNLCNHMQKLINHTTPPSCPVPTPPQPVLQQLSQASFLIGSLYFLALELLLICSCVATPLHLLAWKHEYCSYYFQLVYHSHACIYSFVQIQPTY